MEFHFLPSDKHYGHFGIIGHVGVGHVHSHSGYVQDDSAGFAAAACLLRRAFPVDTTIVHAQADPNTGCITIITKGGGMGKTTARRGITPAECELVSQRALGKDAIFCQAAAISTFGRMYGQGALEVPCAFEGACALAVVDTFLYATPHRFCTMDTPASPQRDVAIAAVLDIDKFPVTIMLIVNFTEGGIGPNEDYEGNTAEGVKGKVIQKMNLSHTPTIILESKAFIPTISPKLDQPKILIRAQKDVDNTILAHCLIQTANEHEIPYLFCDDLMPFSPGSLRKSTCDFADKIICQALRLKEVDDSADKVKIIAELNKMLSEDAGGISFMSNSVHDRVRSAGIVSPHAVIVSMVVTEAYRQQMSIPMFTLEDATSYADIVMGGLKYFTSLAQVPHERRGP